MGKAKGRVVPLHSIKAHRGTTGMALFILKLRTCGHLLYLVALPPEDNAGTLHDFRLLLQ